MMTVQNREDMRVELEEDMIDEMDSFEYLDSVVCNDGDVLKEVGIRIGKAGSILRKVWNSCGISLDTKIKLFNGTVVAILIFGRETWKALNYVENRLRVFDSNCLWKIMNIRWYEQLNT